MKFPYVRFSIYYRPVIPVSFTKNNKSISYQALIDTGADISIIHSEIAEILGITLEKGRAYHFGGITGNGMGYIHNIDLNIGGSNFLNIPIVFSADISPEGYGILGHEYLFEKFKLVFEYRKKQLEIISKEYKRK